MQFTKSKKVAAAVGAGAIVVAASGIAYAYYAAGASGGTTGSAGVKQVTVGDVTLTAATTVSDLVPGAAAKNSTVTVSNPNGYSVSYPAFTIHATYSSSTTTACTSALASISGSKSVDAGTLGASGTLPVSVPVSMGETGTDQSACNGAPITVAYDISVP